MPNTVIGLKRNKSLCENAKVSVSQAKAKKPQQFSLFISLVLGENQIKSSELVRTTKMGWFFAVEQWNKAI